MMYQMRFRIYGRLCSFYLQQFISLTSHAFQARANPNLLHHPGWIGSLLCPVENRRRLES